MIRVVAAILLLASPVVAQDTETAPADDGTTVATDGQGTLITSPITGETALIQDLPANDVRALSADGVALKGLDKVSGEVTDLELAKGETKPVGRIEVTLGDCRYPEDNLAGEGYAWLTIRDPARDAVIFEGWMVASSPALNALDHPRYDVWVIRCTTA